MDVSVQSPKHDFITLVQPCRQKDELGERLHVLAHLSGDWVEGAA